MAIYDYRCTRCEELFESEHAMSGPDPRRPVTCPVCKTAEVNKVFLGAPAVRVWFRNPSLAHHSSDKRPRYKPPVLAKKEAVEYGNKD